MLTLKQAKMQAIRNTKICGEPFIVFEVPRGALINTTPLNTYNKGKYWTCRESERQLYYANGARFVA